MTSLAKTQLKTFLATLQTAIGLQATSDGPLKDAFHRAFAGLPGDEIALNELKPGRLPACRHLESCCDSLADAPMHLHELAQAFNQIEPMLAWYNRRGSESSLFNDSHANSIIVGPDALLPSSSVEIGVTVMAPHTTYPDHRHPPEEVYIALSPGQWRQNDGPWNEPGIGGLIYNPGNIVHSMRSGQEPLFAFWCLPLP